MTISGKYVRTFAEATHALPEGMHMNADYPFMLPRISATDGRSITIVGRGGETAKLAIEREGDHEFAFIAQSSSFERMFRRKPQRFRLAPFRAQEGT